MKDRRRNFEEVLARLDGEEYQLSSDGETQKIPMVFITENCVEFWATVPGLMIDNVDPEKGPGLNPVQEDHVYDEFAYALRSRPYRTTEQDRVDMEREEYYEKLQDAKERDEYTEYDYLINS